ncbi:hypothetical protein CGRA01v4_10776 [Colletotrichum graminicola]|nr:hypothetical protein CGRA01v4_10776 [Colletotrichum graminicola]
MVPVPTERPTNCGQARDGPGWRLAPVFIDCMQVHVGLADAPEGSFCFATTVLDRYAYFNLTSNFPCI